MCEKERIFGGEEKEKEGLSNLWGDSLLVAEGVLRGGG